MFDDIVPKELTSFLVDSLKPNQYFEEEFVSKHRIHQLQGISSLNNLNLGQISIPTGTGKTRIQVHKHIEALKEAKDNYIVTAIVSHRLLLNKQLLDDLVGVAAKSNILFNVLFIGSSKADKNEYNQLYPQHNGNIRSEFSLDPDRIMKFRVESAKEGRHLLIVCTIHSILRLSVLDNIKIMTVDEAHILEGGDDSDFKSDLDSIRGKVEKIYFFTATRRIHGNNGGMNDTEFYGEIAFSMSPRQAINAMEIVPPHIHVIRLQDENGNKQRYSNLDMQIMTIVTGFREHEKMISDVSADSSKIAAKIMVCMEYNTESMMQAYNHENFRMFCNTNNIQRFVFSSIDGGSYFVNDEQVNRNEIMKRMKLLKDTDKAILFHINILSEGIDLPSITGVLAFREMAKDKAIQSWGRGARLLTNDRIRFYNGEITEQEGFNFRQGKPHKLVKPCFFILIPAFYEPIGDSLVVEETIRQVYNEYQLTPIEYQAIERGISHANPDLETITDVHPDLGGDVTTVTHIMKNIEEANEVNEIREQLSSITTEEDYLACLTKMMENNNA